MEHVEVDRLSSLPDELIHKILSFINIKDAISISVLSSRWRFIWTSMPYLNFENIILNHGRQFSKFISEVLSHRNNQIQLSSVKLVLGRTLIDDESVARILNCAFSHNIKHLTVTRSPGEFIGYYLFYRSSFIATPKWDLPALTTLDLHHVKLSNDNDGSGFFSKCTNLKNLSLIACTLMKGTKVLNICLPRLSKLTLKYIRANIELIAPQLKNLTIRWCVGKHLISTPGLTSLVIQSYQRWQLSYSTQPGLGLGFPCLEKVDLFVHYPSDADVHKIVSLLQHLPNVKLLTLNLDLLESLSSSMELIPHQVCVFDNAKILKFTTKTPVKVYLEVTNSTDIKNNDDSLPNAIFPMISHEEIRAMWDMASAQVLVKQLRVLLKECRANTNSDTNNAHMHEHGKSQVGKHCAWALQLNLREMMPLIQHTEIVAALETCLMMPWIRQKYIQRSETPPIIAWLEEMCAVFERIERLITQLSASKRVVLQPVFLSLCEDATILTNNMLGWIRTVN
ncbi:hypothetical protein Lser_V15G12052 [Lactuca serriola]